MIRAFFRKVFGRLSSLDYRLAVAVVTMIAQWSLAFGALILVLLALTALKYLLIGIPPGIQLACVVLVLLTVLLLASMLRERRRALHAIDHFLSVFGEFKSMNPSEKRYGIDPEKMKAMRRKANALRGKPKSWWRALEESLECYKSPDGRQGWFVTRPVGDSLSEDDVILSFYHASFHQVVPGMLTALGLLATFVAILLALSNVTYNPQDADRPITGIDQLINGLSGKFLSSIIALILSVIFVLAEKKICERPLYTSYEKMLTRCNELFPLLSRARILLDIERLGLNLSGSVREAVDYGAAEG
jgi:hypothetical protein